MKRRFHYSRTEILIALGVVALLGYSLYFPATKAVYSFLIGLPWNP
jgi:hypothetical protein